MSSTGKFFDISKDFRFESAHRLAKNYMGKCAQLHGHSWNGTLTVRCVMLDDWGMGIDFGVLKEAVIKEIEEIFDHKVILYQGDPLNKILEESGYGQSIVTMLDNPTSEVIAEWIFDFASEKLNTKMPENRTPKSMDYRDLLDSGMSMMYQVVAVKIRETCTSECKVTERRYENRK